MVAVRIQGWLPLRWLRLGLVLALGAGACLDPTARSAVAPEAGQGALDAGLAEGGAEPQDAHAEAGAAVVGVVTLVPINPVCPEDGDMDGLSTQVELDAGLDPRRADTNADGCADLAELLLGGCQDPRRVVGFNRCFTGDVREQVEFSAPARAAGPWSRLTLAIDTNASDAISAVTIRALATPGALPASEGASFISVDAGTKLVFEIALKAQYTCPRTLVLKLVSDTGEAVDQGMFVVAYRECPIVI